MDRLPIQVFKILYEAYTHFNEDDGWAMASHVALSVILALFPFLIFVAALAAFFGAGQYADLATEALFSSLPETIAGPIANEAQQVMTIHRGDVLTVSIVLAAWFASSGIEAVRTALNRAYQAKEMRSYFFLRAQSLSLVLFAAATMLLVGLLGGFGPVAWSAAENFFPALADFRDLFFFLRSILVAGALIITLTIFHAFLPYQRPFLLRLWPGIVFTFLGIIAATILFATYLSFFTSYVSTYAGLAGIMTAIIYLYLSALILIFGAEVNAAIEQRRNGASSHENHA